MPYKTIICPVDGSKLTDAAAQEAAYLCKVTGAKLLLLNVVEKWYRSTHLVTDSVEWQTLHQEWLADGKKMLQEVAAKLDKDGVKDIDFTVRDGDAAHEIVALAMEQRADLIVMATHRYSPVGKLFVGSVTDKVSRHAPCPVMWVFAKS